MSSLLLALGTAGWLGFDLLRGGLLPALLGAPLLVAVGLWSLRARRAALRKLYDERFARRAESGVSRARGALRVLLTGAAAVLIAAALVGPARGWSLREARQKGIDLVVCIDTSRSMLARDLRPDRLTRAKREVQGLLGQLKGNRMALVAFAGDARDIAPLTRDRSALEQLLEPLSPDDNRAGGTNLAAAIERSLALLDGRSGAHEAIVVLTDGEDLEAKGLEAAAQAQQRGIRVWVVGIGTAAGGKIPLSARDGREGFLKDSAGREVVTQLAGATLKRLAESTGADYLSTEQSPTPLEDLYRLRIERLETRALEQGLLRIPHDRYQWFLLPGLACALAALLLTERRTAQRAAALGARTFALALPCLLAWQGLQSGSLAAQESQPAALSAAPAPYAGTSERGLAELIAHLRAGKREEALALAGRLLERRGTSALDERTEAEILYATGHALAAAQLGDAALQAFSSARVLAGPGELRLWSSYNAGATVLGLAEQLHAARLAAAAGAPGGVPGAAPVPVAPGAPPAGANPGDAAPDPAAQRKLEKDAYLQARALLLDRLRLARADDDTRANLELAVRRLREIEREEQAEQQQQQQQDQDPKDSQQQDKDSSKPSPDGKQDPSKPPNQDPQQDPKQGPPQGPPQDPSAGDQQQREDPQQGKQDSKPQQPQDSKPQPGDPNPDDAASGSEPKPEPGDPQSDATGKPDPKDDKQAAQPGGEPPPGLDPSKLTREELVQLLDRLSEIDKEAQKVRAAARRASRKPVEKDW